MRAPDVSTEWHDEKNNFTFRVLAYREVTAEEMRQSFTFWMQSERRKKIPKNQCVEVISILGHKD